MSLINLHGSESTETNMYRSNMSVTGYFADYLLHQG